MSYAFKLCPHLMSSDCGYLHTAAHKVLCLLPRNDVGRLPTARPINQDFDVTCVPPSLPTPDVLPPTPALPPPPSPPSPPSAFSQYRERNPASRRLRPDDACDLPRPRASVGPVSTAGGEIKVPASRGAGLVSKEAMTHCFPPTTEIHRGRKRERLVDDIHRRATQAGESPRWCSPAQLPAKIAATEDDVNAFKPTAQHPRPPLPYRDRFKILRSDGLDGCIWKINVAFSSCQEADAQAGDYVGWASDQPAHVQPTGARVSQWSFAHRMGTFRLVECYVS